MESQEFAIGHPPSASLSSPYKLTTSGVIITEYYEMVRKSMVYILLLSALQIDKPEYAYAYSRSRRRHNRRR